MQQRSAIHFLMTEGRLDLIQRVKNKELKMYYYRKVEQILKGIHLELLKAKLRDMEARKLMLEVE